MKNDRDKAIKKVLNTKWSKRSVKSDLPDAICPYCHTAFLRKTANQKYCSLACATAYNRERARNKNIFPMSTVVKKEQNFWQRLVEAVKYLFRKY